MAGRLPTALAVAMVSLLTPIAADRGAASAARCCRATSCRTWRAWRPSRIPTWATREGSPRAARGRSGSRITAPVSSTLYVVPGAGNTAVSVNPLTVNIPTPLSPIGAKPTATSFTPIPPVAPSRSPARTRQGRPHQGPRCFCSRPRTGRSRVGIPESIRVAGSRARTARARLRSQPSTTHRPASPTPGPSPAGRPALCIRGWRSTPVAHRSSPGIRTARPCSMPPTSAPGRLRSMTANSAYSRGRFAQANALRTGIRTGRGGRHKAKAHDQRRATNRRRRSIGRGKRRPTTTDRMAEFHLTRGAVRPESHHQAGGELFVWHGCPSVRAPGDVLSTERTHAARNRMCMSLFEGPAASRSA